VDKSNQHKPSAPPSTDPAAQHTAMSKSKAKSNHDDLTEEQLADLKEAFAMFDINGDGTCLSVRHGSPVNLRAQ
jgi:hypothetical protein